MQRKGLVLTIIGLVGTLVVVLVVLRVLNIFPATDKAEGTIGGVEKVERFRGQQMTIKDVKTDDPEVTRFIQSAEFQNLLKDENFRILLANPERAQLLPTAVEINQMVSQAALNFYNCLLISNNAAKFFGSKEYQQFYQSLNKEAAAGLIEPLKSEAGNIIIPSAQELQSVYLFNSELQKFVLGFPFKIVLNQDIQGVFGTDFVKFLAGDFQGLKLQSFGFLSSDFQKLINSQTLHTIICSQEFQKIVLNQEFQKYVLSQEFQKCYFNQEFQKFLLSQEFQKGW